jgi:hypothetical protein
MIGKGKQTQRVTIAGEELDISSLIGVEIDEFWALWDQRKTSGKAAERRAVAFGLFKCCRRPDGSACYATAEEPLAEDMGTFGALEDAWLNVQGLLGKN